jgi:hypothetical protein
MIFRPGTKVVDRNKCCCCFKPFPKGAIGGKDFFSTIIDYADYHPIPAKKCGYYAKVCPDCMGKFNYIWVT